MFQTAIKGRPLHPLKGLDPLFRYNRLLPMSQNLYAKIYTKYYV